MPTYERWKYCGHKYKNGRKCNNVAENECTASCNHPDDPNTQFKLEKGRITKEQISKHPRFLCNGHINLYNN